MSQLGPAEVIICLGPGGVGKTTMSAAIGLAAAQAGRKVVVLTIDPARRLADAMGLPAGLTNDPTLVPLPADVGGELWAAMLDPKATFIDVVRSHADVAQAERIIGNRLFENLTSSLSGTNEYMASERLWSLSQDDRFDLVVVDTPPSRHAIDFLDSPSRLVRFIEHPLYRHVLAPRRGLMRAVNLAAQLVVRATGRVVGADLLNDVVDFFAAFEGLDEGFRSRADHVNSQLLAPETRYILVTAPRPDPIAGGRWIAGRLAERDRQVHLLVANRMTPQHLAAAQPKADAVGPLDENLAQLAGMARDEAALIDEFSAEIGAGEVIRINDQAIPISTLDGLAEVAQLLPDQLVSS